MNEIIVERGCAERLASIKDKYSGLYIISDDNVFPVCGKGLKKILGGCLKGNFIFSHGEKEKNINTVLSALNAMAESGLDRDGAVIALGGGVTGDIAGLCAALYMRGISLIMMPTSLLAIIDSSIGGKNGVDFAGRKNLIGSFRSPDAVLCDMSMLDTLPEYYYTDGLGELIKYAFIEENAFPGESSLHDMLSDGIDNHIAEAVRRCIDIKTEIVRRDPYDLGERHLLNFGHTVGHAIEAAGNYTLSHGRAVAAGMAVISRAAAECGICGQEVPEKLEDYLSRCSLPDKSPFGADVLMPFITGDKKRSGNTVSLILPETPSRCRIVPTEFDRLNGMLVKVLTE